LFHRILVTIPVALCALSVSPASLAKAVAAAAPPETASVAAAPALDPWLDDPWLSEAGPSLSDPPGVVAATSGEDRVIQVWRAAPPNPEARAAALRRLRLEYGLGNLRIPARIVNTTPTDADAAAAAAATELALELAPGMPALRWARIQHLWQRDESGAAVKEFGELLWSMAHQLESQLWLVGNGLLIAWLVGLVAAGAFIVLLGLKAIPHAAHDLGDLLAAGMPASARFALIASLLLLPLWLGEGVAGFVLAAFALAFLYGRSNERSVLVMTAIFWVVALHPFARWASVAATVVDLDPIARSALAVANGMASRADVERLEAAFDEDLVAAHALAYRDRRFGDEDAAKRRLEALIDRYPADPVVLANLGNQQMRAGDMKGAIDRYERAATQINSPDLLFDLSQAYANVLRIDESEATLARAQQFGDHEVGALSSLTDPKLVADLEFPIELVGERLRTEGLAHAQPIQLAQILAPGRLGRSFGATGTGFAAALLVASMLGGRFDRSSLCSRCSHRVCSRCDRRLANGELCASCHHLFRNPEATDPKLRMARMQTLAKRDARLSGLLDVGSIVVPGLAGLSIRRPDLALLGIGFSVAALAWHRWPTGLIVDPLWIGPLGSLFFTALGAMALAGHASIVVGSLIARRNR
jgi:tetratricopeptide (TPR) repeat protein